MGRLFLLSCAQPGGSGISFLPGFRHHGSFHLTEPPREGRAPFPLRVAAGAPPCLSAAPPCFSLGFSASWAACPPCMPALEHLLLSLAIACSGLEYQLKASPRFLGPSCLPTILHPLHRGLSFRMGCLQVGSPFREGSTEPRSHAGRTWLYSPLFTLRALSSDSRCPIFCQMRTSLFAVSA